MGRITTSFVHCAAAEGTRTLVAEAKKLIRCSVTCRSAGIFDLREPAQKKANVRLVVSMDVESNHVGASGGGLSDGPMCSVRLPMFEGPLELLLHLCQKHELNILDIPISFVTEKYLEYLAVMQLMQLDIASEYLLMAATLAHIKSKLLLPTPPPEADEDGLLDEIDPRGALIRRLLEYQKYKHAAHELASRGIAGRDIFFRGAPVEEAVHTGLPPLAEVPLFSLVEAFQHVLAKAKLHISHDIVADRISITDRIHELVDVLRLRSRVMFEELFSGQATKFDLVITFLACLEMTRLKMTHLTQSDPLGPIYVEMSPDVAPDEVDLLPSGGAM